MKKKIDYQVGDILFIAGTNFNYKIIDKDDMYFIIQKINSNSDRRLYINERMIKLMFETTQQQRKHKLNKIKYRMLMS